MKYFAFFLFACCLITACKKDAAFDDLTPANRPPFFVSGKIKSPGDTAAIVFDYRTGQVFDPGTGFNSGTQENNYLVANSIVNDVVITATFKSITGTLELDSQRVFYLAFENPDSIIDMITVPQTPPSWSKTEIEQFFQAGKSFNFDHVFLALTHQDQLAWREDSSIPADNHDSYVRVDKLEDLEWEEKGIAKAGKVITFSFQCRIAGIIDPNRVFEVTEGMTTLYFGYE